MKRALLAAMVTGCFSPSPQPGAPCPDGLCPTGLACSSVTQTCEVPGATTDAPIDTDDALCDPLTAPEYGTVTVTNNGAFPSTATYACPAGFELTGIDTQTCAEDGTWSALPPTCEWTGPRVFTNCEQVGPTGPSQEQCATAYTDTTLAGMVNVDEGIQHWTVPAAGTYRIVVNGAAGGSIGAFLGARVQGDFVFAQGVELKILVGQLPTGSLAGGGGSFVTDAANAPLIIAGGAGSGGCAACTPEESGGRIEPTGGTMTGVARATDGQGGASGNAVSGAGGGLLGDGAQSGGKAFVNGGIGATGISGFIGGFGGGGARNGGNGAGAGGGYSGGSANSNGTDTTLRFGGGGGSLNTGDNPDGTPNINPGHGSVTIDLL